MKKIRDTTIRSILTELDQTLFTEHGFDCEFNKPNGEIVCLKFRDNPKFQFVVFQDKITEIWKTSECPGIMFTDSEEYQLKDFSGARGRIKSWVLRILEELTTGGEDTTKIFKEMRSNLNKTSEELSNPNEPFEQKEATAWQKTLDSVVKQFEALKKDNKIQKRDLTTLKNEVNKLKDSIKSVPKKTWFKAAGNKILNSLEGIADRELAQSLVESGIKGVVKGLLGNGS